MPLFWKSIHDNCPNLFKPSHSSYTCGTCNLPELINRHQKTFRYNIQAKLLARAFLIQNIGVNIKTKTLRDIEQLDETLIADSEFFAQVGDFTPHARGARGWCCAWGAWVVLPGCPSRGFRTVWVGSATPESRKDAEETTQ